MKVHKRLDTLNPDCDKCIWEVIGRNYKSDAVYYPTTYCGHADYENKFIDKINSNSLEWEDVGYTKDDACDAYVIYAEWNNGVALTDEELDEFMNDYDARCYYAESLYTAQTDNLESLADRYKDMMEDN